MKKTLQSVNGTSFHDTTIKFSVSTLTKILGEPHYSGNDGNDKTNFEWQMETDNGDVFTVYDWKEYRPLNESEIIEWHIGGMNKNITETAVREIMDAMVNKLFY
jgi:hypothetical protein